jgi:hypothetical protein
MRDRISRANPLNFHEPYFDNTPLNGPPHLIPSGDSRVHVVDDAVTCWCCPKRDEDSGYIIHTSADGREDYEEGWRQPH